MNVLNRMMSYDKTKSNYENCNCTDCNDTDRIQTVEYPLLTEEEIKQIIKERYDYKDEKTKTFIRKALRKHGDRYDYSNVVYVKAREKVEIICRFEGHPNFLQEPCNHLQGQGCKKCANDKLRNERTMGLKKFIEKANEIHGVGRYDYSKVNYVNNSTEVTIICHNHEEPYEFQQIPNNHLQGKGCMICGGKQKLKLNDIIKRFNNIHGEGTYNYSKVEYVNNKTEVIIICPIHGEFKQTPINHLKGEGCSICGINNGAKIRTMTTKEFIKKANEKQGIGIYNYSKVEYIDSRTDVIIICPKHGEFTQTPSAHLQGEGCPKCNKNKGECIIRRFLTEKGIKYEEQKTFEGCKNINLLKFDFYLPKYNLCIESDGSPHYRKVNWNGKMTDDEMEENLKLNRYRDNIKNEYCKKNGIGLLRLNDFKTFEDKLTEYFQIHEIIKS